MNNKLIWLFIGLLIAAIAKLSFDVYATHPKTIDGLNIIIDQQGQKIGNLNDQLIVLQRQSQTVPQASTATNTNTMIHHDAGFNHSENYVRDYLDLIQLSLEQQHFSAALEQIQDLQQRLNTQPLLNGALNQAVLAALQQDRQHLQQYLKQRTQQAMLLQQQLNQLEHQLKPVALESTQQKWDFQNWFNIRPADDIPALENRYLQYRYLQLKVLLAQQSLLAGQIDLYQRQLADIQTQLQQYPDANSQNMMKQLRKIDVMSLGIPPNMSAVALLRGL